MVSFIPSGRLSRQWRTATSASSLLVQAALTHYRYRFFLRGIEIQADVMFKGTRVDGIYTADPEKDPTATKFRDITYDEIYTKGLKVMDLTATTMCKENNLPIYVFNMDVVGNLKKVMEGEEIVRSYTTNMRCKP